MEMSEIKYNNKMSFLELANELLSDFPVRSQEIIKKRFGLLDGREQTLEKIGKEYGVTRERVRQIISDVLKKISKKQEDVNFKKAEEKIVLAINEKDGIIEEKEILKGLGSDNLPEAKAAIFFAYCSEKIIVSEKDDSLKKSWALSKEFVEQAKRIEAAARAALEKEKSLLSDKELAEKILAAKQGENPGKNPGLSEKSVLHYLGLLVGIKKNKFDKWGIVDWKEVSPKGTRERIHLVLKEKNRPLHFTEIAGLIDEYKLGKRKAHPQTVHNELIKDERFVLIGRGTYALREWGYKEGTVRDILEDILKKSPKALSREEIIAEVSRVRKVKEATIVINLNNNKSFVRAGNRYSLRR